MKSIFWLVLVFLSLPLAILGLTNHLGVAEKVAVGLFGWVLLATIWRIINEKVD